MDTEWTERYKEEEDGNEGKSKTGLDGKDMRGEQEEEERERPECK